MFIKKVYNFALEQRKWAKAGRPYRTEAKIQELRAAEPMRLLRVQRDKLLAETDWISSKYYDLEQSVPNEWKFYRQALRDLPETATPVLDPTSRLGISGVDWPVKPE